MDAWVPRTTDGEIEIKAGSWMLLQNAGQTSVTLWGGNYTLRPGSTINWHTKDSPCKKDEVCTIKFGTTVIDASATQTNRLEIVEYAKPKTIKAVTCGGGCGCGGH